MGQQATWLLFVTVAPICSVLLLLFGLFPWGCRLYYRKRHILSGIDLNQPILYVAATAPQHFMEVWHYWSGVLICHCSASFPDPVYTQSAIQLPSILWACPDEWSCASRGNATSVLVDFLWLHCWWFCLTFLWGIWYDLSWPSDGRGDCIYGMIWDMMEKLFIPKSFLPKYQCAWDSDFRGIHFHVTMPTTLRKSWTLMY